MILLVAIIIGMLYLWIRRRKPNYDFGIDKGHGESFAIDWGYEDDPLSIDTHYADAMKYYLDSLGLPKDKGDS